MNRNKVDFCFYGGSPSIEIFNKIMNDFDIEFELIYHTGKVIQIDILNFNWYNTIKDLWFLVLYKVINIKSISYTYIKNWVKSIIIDPVYTIEESSFTKELNKQVSNNIWKVILS